MAFTWIGKSKDGSTVTLHKLCFEMFSIPKYFTPAWASENSELMSLGAAIDVETTGLDHSKDKIIEIGLRLFTFNRMTGELLNLSSCYSGLQDPGIPLSNEIIELTGITDDMLKGQAIDWNNVNSLISKCHVIIAHNAAFDRPFIDSASTESRNKLWGCSLKQVDWDMHRFPSHKLDVLSIYHGFFTDAHRALNDVDALVYLLSLKSKANKNPYLLELVNNAKKPSVLISALFAPYDKKDFLKSRHYKWDATNKVWQKEIYQEHYDAEIKWLEENIYQGIFKGKSVIIEPGNHFKK